MRIVGLIAEYNPFHNGHQYHIEKAREITNADAVIVVMSGNFVQRGTPAIMPKHLRAEAALRSGASLVIELPVCYATGSAEFFAYGTVSLLDKLGCIDSICFGSECGDIEVLQDFAKIIQDEPVEYKEYLNQYLRHGNAFPLARQKALKDYLRSDIVDSVLAEPNNILGIEYLKALYRLNSKITPHTIQRISSHYHDEELQETYSSASAIRKEIAGKTFDHSDLENQIPDTSISILQENYQRRYPVYANDFSILLKYKLLGETKTSLVEYADVSEELANRIANHLNQYLNFEQFCELLKTKEVTYSRISRALLHILLDIKKDDYTEIEYARVLGFRKDSMEILSQIKKQSSIPLLSKLTASKELSLAAARMLNKDILVSDLYESVITDKFETSFKNEYEQQIIRI
ncbi:MAG: nucleotidyltransferase [Tyzzerella sp.]|nr:nucleotidyltransferase [Tyzzerella sp.]